MLNPAKVRFIGDERTYKLACDQSFMYCSNGEDETWLYCRDCEKKDCQMESPRRFVYSKVYNAYFLEYWSGTRDSLHVKGEDGIIDHFIPLADFEIVSDVDNVLNNYEAVVKCVVRTYERYSMIYYGKEYKAIGVDKQGAYLVLDESGDCYFYPSSAFEIINDDHGILDVTKHYCIYDWSIFSE